MGQLTIHTVNSVNYTLQCVIFIFFYKNLRCLLLFQLLNRVGVHQTYCLPADGDYCYNANQEQGQGIEPPIVAYTV